MPTRRKFLAASAAAAVIVQPLQAFAQALHKPVRIVVGFPAGGGTDVIARLVADKLRGHYAPAVIVENRPGAAARIAVEFVKNAEPDGSTLLFTPDFPMTVYPHSYKTLSYDPIKDFTPVTACAKSMLTFNVGPAVPASVKTVGDFVTWCRANPDKAQYGTTSPGATPHFVGVMLGRSAKLDLTPVHYKGGAPALQDLLGGHVPASVNPISETLAFGNSGMIRILAVTGRERSRFLPDVPTMVESGYQDVVVESWLGLFAPAKVPADVVGHLSDAVRDALASADLRESLSKIGNDPAYSPPAKFAATVKADLEAWGPVVKASGFVAED
jgi:tripartite-type tricarboxylate transporter receptor subunit TctC